MPCETLLKGMVDERIAKAVNNLALAIRTVTVLWQLPVSQCSLDVARSLSDSLALSPAAKDQLEIFFSFY